MRDAGEPGIAGATVRLYKDDNNDDMPDGSVIRTTTTDNNGNYIFNNLNPGNYIVGVVIPTGYVRGPQTETDPDNNIDNDNNGYWLEGNNTPGGEVRSKAITLAAGTEPTNDGDGSNGNLTLDIALCESTPVHTPNPPADCPNNLASSGSGYFGGFEAGSGNFSANTGSDLYYGLPRNGSYQIVKHVNDLGGGGYLNIKARSGDFFLAAHTSNNSSERVWYTKLM
jgi:hypothetical protein